MTSKYLWDCYRLAVFDTSVSSRKSVVSTWCSNKDLHDIYHDWCSCYKGKQLKVLEVLKLKVKEREKKMWKKKRNEPIQWSYPVTYLPASIHGTQFTIYLKDLTHKQTPSNTFDTTLGRERTCIRIWICILNLKWSTIGEHNTIWMDTGIEIRMSALCSNGSKLRVVMAPH